jgi:hypothetical protein
MNLTFSNSGTRMISQFDPEVTKTIGRTRKKSRDRRYSRSITLPVSHPLHTHVRRATHYVKSHRSPLHDLLHAFEINLRDMETIKTV